MISSAFQTLKWHFFDIAVYGPVGGHEHHNADLGPSKDVGKLVFGTCPSIFNKAFNKAFNNGI